MLIDWMVVMMVDWNKVNAYCYVEYIVSWHTMMNGNDRSEATIMM